MDVPAAAVAAPAPLPPTLAPSPTPAAGVATSEPPAAATPAPAAVADPATDAAIKPVVAKLFNTTSANIVVSFQVVKDLNEVVTVFTDKTTGKEIVQFPSRQLIALAEFFSQLAGNVLDKTA